MNWPRALLRFLIPAPAWRWLLPALLLLAWGGTVVAATDSLALHITVNIRRPPPVIVTLPVITGTTTQGMTLSTSNGAWTDPWGDSLTFTYQWRRALDDVGTGSVDITGATSLAYLLTSFDAGMFVTCRVTAHDLHGGSAAADAAWVGAVVGTGTPTVALLPVTSALSPIITDEHGTPTMTMVSLSTMPTGVVTINLVNPAPAEIALSTSSLVFTPVNWYLPQTVTFTGQADGVVDGDQLVTVTTSVVAGGTNYASVTAAPIYVRNSDVDVPGLAITQTSGSTAVREGGPADTVDVKLNAQPSGTVTVTLTGSSELNVAPATLTFDAGNWNVPQTVSLTAPDDHVADGTHSVLELFTATGGGYTGETASLPVTIYDRDTPTVELTPSTGVTTTDTGGATVLHLRLTSQPTADVTFPLSSSDLSRGTVGPASLTFTAANWDQYQDVTLTGAIDRRVTGDLTWNLVTGACVSTDPAYSGTDPPDVAVVNRDTDHAAVLASPNTVVVSTISADTAYFQVALTSQPTADVTVTSASSDTGMATVGPATLTFTAADWMTPQTVTVTGTTNASYGAFTVGLTATSADALYNGLPPVSVAGDHVDASLPMLLITQAGPLTLTEGTPGTASYDVRLSVAPSADVTVTPTPDGALTTSAPLTFTPANYNVAQTVTVAAVDDDVAMGVHLATVTNVIASGDADYNALPPQVVQVTVTDNDVAGIAVVPAAGLQTTEAGGTATFTVSLTSKPTGTVTIRVTSSDPAQGTVDDTDLGTPGVQDTLTFDETNWNELHTVTVTGADPGYYDAGGVPYGVQVGPSVSADLAYDGFMGPAVSLSNRSVDKPPTMVALSDLTIPEDAGTQTVLLTGISNGQPGEAQTVTVTALSSDPALTGALTVNYANPDSFGTVQFTPALHAAGTATITVSVSDGVTTVPQSFLLTVSATNYPPTVARNTELIVNYQGAGAYQGANADPLAPGQLVAADVETPAALLRWHLVLAPAVGQLAVGGVPLAAGDEVLQGQIDAGLLTYTHAGGLGATDGFMMRIIDGGGAMSAPVVVTITIVPNPPVITLGSPAGVPWTEGGGAVALFTGATVADADSADFDTGNLTVAIAANGRVGDLVAIRNDGNGPGQIGVVGNTVSYGGVAIGTFTGGDWPTPLVVSLDVNATPAATQALAQAVTFTNTTPDPGALDRTVSLAITDDGGHTSAPQTVQVLMSPVDNPPVIAAFLDLATVADLPVDGQLVATDPDSAALTYAVTVPPTLGTVTVFNPLTGAFTYQPNAGAVGLDTFTMTVSDGTTTVPVSVSVNITGQGTAKRIWIISDSVLEAQSGDTLSWVVKVDVSELPVVPAPNLQFSLIGTPTDVSLVADAATNSATVTWPKVTGTSHMQFSVKVVDTVSGASDVQPVVLYIHPLPGGGL
jgi:hypothetical protein